MNEPVNSPVVLTAAWIAPMPGSMLRDGAILFRDGIIAAVGSITSLRDQMTDATVIDAGNAVILPGLVNAHTHLELSNIQRGEPPARFVDWIISLMNTPISTGGVEAGIAQCLRFGVTAIGDITSNPTATRRVLTNSPLRGVSYGEVRAMALRREFLEPRIASSLEPMKEVGGMQHGGRLGIGITPHAPYSVESAGYTRCLAVAVENNLPLATHLAETPDEATFLAHHSGPFRELWDYLKAWDDRVPRFEGGPIRFANQLGLLNFPTLLAHVNYCDDDELNLLAAGKASVVYCPRTHRFFGHSPHHWREMLARGINVAVGTDSCASSADLNLVDDLRLLHSIAPEVEVSLLWEMATKRAARAIDHRNIGSLEVGMAADAVVFPAVGDDPLREILESQAMPAAVWLDGQKR